MPLKKWFQREYQILTPQWEVVYLCDQRPLGQATWTVLGHRRGPTGWDRGQEGEGADGLPLGPQDWDGRSDAGLG